MSPTVQLEASPPPSAWVTRDVRRVLVGQVLFGFAWSLFLLVPKFLTTELQAGPDDIGRITAVGGVAGLATVPLAGYALDRWGRLLFFRLGAGLLILIALGFTRAHGVGPFLYVLQGGITASFVLSFNAAASLMTDYTPPQHMGRAIGWLGGANVLMNAVSTMVAEPLSSAYGWNAVFALGALAGAAALSFSFVLREPAPQSHAPSSTSAGRPALQAMPFQWTALCLILVTTVLIGGSFIAAFGFLQPFALAKGAHEVRGFFLGFSIAAVGCRVTMGGLGDRIGRRLVSIWSLAGYGISALSMQHLDVDWLVAYGFVFGAAHGILYPTLNALLLELLPIGRRGLGMVLYNGAFNLGISVGSLGWGSLAARYGYPVVFATAAVSAFMGCALLMFKPRGPS